MARDVSIGEYSEALEEKKWIPFETSRSLINKGMCVCCDCGRILSTDYKYCGTCRTYALIIIKE